MYGKTKTQTTKRTARQKRIARKAARLARLARQNPGTRTQGYGWGVTPKSLGGDRSGSGRLARLGSGTTGKVRPTSRQVHPRDSGNDRISVSASPVVSSYESESGVSVAKAVRHSTRKSYNAAVKAHRYRTASERSDAPLASGSTLHGARFDEHEFMSGPNRHVIMTGRELLGPVANPPNVTTPTIGVGERLPGCMWPVSPQSLGGRASLMAEEFEQHKLKSLRFIYEPSVPATASGAISLYFTNEIGTETIHIGTNELQHAATHAAFLQTQVWEEACLEVDPSDAIGKYFDSSAGSFKFSVQGVLNCIAASQLDMLAFPSLGNLYVDYEIEFYGEALTFEVSEYIDAVLQITATGTVASVSNDQPMIFRNVEVPGFPGFVLTNYPPEFDGTTWGDLADWMFYATVTEIDGPIADPFISFWSSPSQSTKRFAVGQGFWFRFGGTYGAALGTGSCEVYASLAEANTHPAVAVDAAGDSLVFTLGGPVTAGRQGTLSLYGRWLRLVA